ncbi:hypothetical protein VTL71DRAFT_12569 [Oculimacula yallundae]|uniref:Uncharacterized protein n=1 Tax=Oculimacula yallundae TaxID=86028 RepID=A0ABR4CMX0_9HELO
MRAHTSSPLVARK